MTDPFRITGPAVVSFSGGRTSGYMLWRILQAHGGALPADVLPVFLNTGKERLETLDFVERVSQRWGVRIVWLEYRHTKGVGPGFAVVDYTTASRDGEPLEAAITARAGDSGFLPNPLIRYCTIECKILTCIRYLESLGWESWGNAIGFRADEPQRVAKLRASIREDREDVFTPLVAAGVTKPDILAWWKRQPFDLELGPDESNCDLCLAGETEVATADGIRPIRELAGTVPELLVPKWSNGTLSEVGKFEANPVRSFGVQRLWRVELAGHGQSAKEVFATAEHRWFLVPRKAGGGLGNKTVATSELKPGDRLRNLFRCPIGADRGYASRVGVLRGFVFGDGTGATGNRPGIVQIHEGKDEVFRPWFEAMCGPPVEGTSTTGGRFWHYYGVPSYWKRDYPSLREERHYLMGWLAGWFAADGCVSEEGICVLSCAARVHLEFARSVCAVLGVQCSPITSQTRRVKPPGGVERTHTIYGVNINRHHLTGDFFHLTHHRERVAAGADKEVRRYGWTVKSVGPTDRVEEVFCATVEGAGAFGLADGLMTGNCFLKGKGKLVRIMRDHPEFADWWVRQETRGGYFRSDRPRYAALLAEAQRPGLFPLTDLDEPDELGAACHCTD